MTENRLLRYSPCHLTLLIKIEYNDNMKKGQVTPRQFDRFAAIEKWEGKKGRMPICREVGAMFGIASTSTAFLTLKRYSEWKKRPKK